MKQQELELTALRARVEEAEAIVRAQNRLIVAMYDSDFSASWPTEAAELEAAYCERYGANLDAEAAK